MAVTEGQLVPIGPFPAGANNIALETSVPARSFRKGVNVNVTDDGKVRRREGYTKIIDAYEPRCLYGAGKRAFFAIEGDLYAAAASRGPDGLPTLADVQLIYSGLDPAGELSYTLIEPDVFVSDGQSNLRIGPDNFVSSWSLPALDFPLVTTTEGGSLEAGRYFVAIAAKAMSGEEGPLTDPMVIEVPADGKMFIALPTSIPAGTARVAIYMSKPNGKELLLLTAVPASAGQVTVGKQRLGRPPVSQDLDPMPPCRFSAVWNGRLLVAYGAAVVWSEPNQFALTQSAYNFLPFSEDITMLAAIDTAGGFFVGLGSKTYFVVGANPADASLTLAYSAGVVPGTLVMVPGARLPFDDPPDMPVPMWMATNGVFCVGFMDGSVHPLTETRFVGAHAEAGAAMFDQRNGQNRYVATLRNPSENNFAMSDQITAEVVRNGIPT